MTKDAFPSLGGLRVPFGLRGGALVTALQVTETGLACNCTCPGCGAQLKTRQGKKRRHFAHHKVPGSERCVQRSIHAAAIQVLVGARRVTVPEKVLTVTQHSKSGEAVSRSRQLTREREILFDACESEVTITDERFGTMRPDVIGYRGERKLLLEVCFTHAVDSDKLAKLEQYGRPAIEIDVAHIEADEGFDAVERAVLNTAFNKHWLYFPGEAQALRELTSAVEDEVARLNWIHHKRQLDLRLRAERRALQLEKARTHEIEAEKARRAAAERKFAAYRVKPLGEKKEAIQKRLNIAGKWPNFLNKGHPHNAAIDAPSFLWQSALFARFVFKNDEPKNRFSVLDAIQWVDDWFGRTPNSGLDAPAAIQGFLSYLKGCGFLRYGGLQQGVLSYIVAHNGLTPPPRPQDRRTAIASESVQLSNRGLTQLDHTLIRNASDKLKWNADWPDYGEVRVAVTKWLSMSQSHELLLLDTLYQHRDSLPEPMEFAMIMREHVPLANVVEFLLRYHFVA